MVDIGRGAWVGIPKVIFAKDGMPVPVSNGGGPFGVVAVVFPETMEGPIIGGGVGPAGAWVVEAGEPAGGVGPVDTPDGGGGDAGPEAEVARGGGGVVAGLAGPEASCLLRWRCLRLSLSAFMTENCKTKKMANVYSFIPGKKI